MHPMLETDMRVDAEFTRGLAHIIQDGGPIGNRLRFFPWPEWVRQGEHIRLGANPGKAEQVPGATNLGASLENDVSLAGTACLQTVASPDTGKTGTDDYNIEVLKGHISQIRPPTLNCVANP